MRYTQLLRAYPRYLAFGFLQTFFSSLGQTFLIALFMPSLRKAFDESAASMGAFYGMVTIASAVLLFFTGPLIDRVNLRVYSVCVGLVVACGCFLMFLAPNLGVVVVALFLIRHGGQALMGHTASTAMTRYFTEVRGKALGIAGLGIATGEAVLPFAVASLLDVWSWRSVYLLLGLMCLLCFVPLVLFFVNKHDDIQNPSASQKLVSQHVEEGELNWDRIQVLQHPYFWTLLPLFVLPPFLGTGYFFFQAEIAAHKSWSKQLFASCFLAYGISAALTAFSVGPLIDRWGGRRMIPFSLLPMIPGIWALLAIPHIVGGHLFMVSLGMSFGTAANARNAMWAEVYGRAHLGSIRSFATMVMVFFTALSPPLGGWLLGMGVSIATLLWVSLWIVLGASFLALFAKPPARPSSLKLEEN